MAHYLGIISWIIPVVMRSNAGAFSPFIRAHATAAANMQFTVMIGAFGVLVVFCGLAIVLTIALANPVAMLIGGVLTVLGELALVAWSIVAAVQGGKAAKAGAAPPSTGALRLLK